MSSSNSGRSIAVIDYLRGLAALGVAVFHVRVVLWVGWRAIMAAPAAFGPAARIFAWLSIPAPFLGSLVMLFFVISGFCVHLPQAGKSAPMAFGPYFRRRFLRIYPPYLAAVLLSAFVCWIIPGLTGPSVFPAGRAASSAFMAQNYTTALQNGLTGAPGQLPTNPALWSLPVEMELYLVYPLLLVLIRRIGAGNALAIAGIVSLLAAAGHAAGLRVLDGNFAKYWIIWSSGAWLAEKWCRGDLRPPPVWLTIIAAFALACSLYRDVQRLDAALTHFSYGLFFFWVVWFLLTHPELWSGIYPPMAAGLQWLGSVSYSFYLIHFPLFCLLGAAWSGFFGAKPANFLVPLSACALVLPLIWLFYRTVELPSHRWAKGKRTAGA